MVLKKNMGQRDKAVRILFAVIITLLYFTKVITGAWAIVLGLLALIFLITSSISFCPLYLPLGISTRRKG